MPLFKFESYYTLIKCYAKRNKYKKTDRYKSVYNGFAFSIDKL
jgi:pentatricopeptide repeat protein